MKSAEAGRVTAFRPRLQLAGAEQAGLRCARLLAQQLPGRRMVVVFTARGGWVARVIRGGVDAEQAANELAALIAVKGGLVPVSPESDQTPSSCGRA